MCIYRLIYSVYISHTFFYIDIAFFFLKAVYKNLYCHTNIAHNFYSYHYIAEYLSTIFLYESRILAYYSSCTARFHNMLRYR